MVIHFGEQLIVDLRLRAAHYRHEGSAFEPCGRGNFQKLAERWEKIHLGYQRVRYLPASKTAGAAHHQHHARTVMREIAFHLRESNAVIGSADYQSVLRGPRGFERAQHVAHRRVESARRGVERRDIAARFRHAGDGRRRRAEPLIVAGTGIRKYAMRFLKSNTQKKRLLGRVPNPVDSRGHELGVRVLDGDHFVISDDFRPLRDVLHADERRAVTAVVRLARLGEQVGAASKACRKSTDSSANLRRLGVGRS